MYKKTTQVPNLILDQYLKTLSGGELEILLVIIRQNYGSIDKSTQNTVKPRTGSLTDRLKTKQVFAQGSTL
jgi:hypothetical protein